MPRTPEEFNGYVAKELRAGDKRMNSLADEISAVEHWMALDVGITPWW